MATNKAGTSRLTYTKDAAGNTVQTCITHFNAQGQQIGKECSQSKPPVIPANANQPKPNSQDFGAQMGGIVQKSANAATDAGTKSKVQPVKPPPAVVTPGKPCVRIKGLDPNGEGNCMPGTGTGSPSAYVPAAQPKVYAPAGPKCATDGPGRVTDLEGNVQCAGTGAARQAAKPTAQLPAKPGPANPLAQTPAPVQPKPVAKSPPKPVQPPQKARVQPTPKPVQAAPRAPVQPKPKPIQAAPKALAQPTPKAKQATPKAGVQPTPRSDQPAAMRSNTN